MLGTLVAYYFHFAFAIGITSFRYNRAVQLHTVTKWSWIYATLANVAVLLAMPWLIWISVNGVNNNWSVPPLLVETYRLLLCVNYAAIVYTLLSRMIRERALQQIRGRLPRLFTRLHDDSGCVDSDERFFRCIFYLKYICVIYLTCSRVLGPLFAPLELYWYSFVAMMLLAIVSNILYITTFGYFYELWQMCRGFCYINKQLYILLQSQQLSMLSPRCRRIRKELRRFWAWHRLLTKTSLRLNRIYSVQMLTACFEYIASSVAMGFFSCVFMDGYDTPGFVIAFGAFTYLVLTLDFLLLTKMCDATVQQQRHTVQVLRDLCESPDVFDSTVLEREINAFAVYLSSSKLRLCVWHLFELNRECWLKVLSTVASYTILLLQFYLVTKYK